MSGQKISTELWALPESLIPVFTLSSKGGRQRAVGGWAVPTVSVPLAITVNSAKRRDSMAFERTVDAISVVPGLSGQPRKRVDRLQADEGYDFARYMQHLELRGITARIALRGIESSNGRDDIAGWSTARIVCRLRQLHIRFERGPGIYAE